MMKELDIYSARDALKEKRLILIDRERQRFRVRKIFNRKGVWFIETGVHGEFACSSGQKFFEPENINEVTI